MSEYMASPSVAIDSLFASSGSSAGEDGEGGQAKAPPASDTPTKSQEGASKGDGTTGKAPEATTAKVEGAATSPTKESADLSDEYKPFKQILEGKKWDPKAKDFAPNVLKSYADLEKSFTQSNQDKSLLNTRQTELQKRLMGDTKSINEWRKANKLPEIPVAKSYGDQLKEKSELFAHLNKVLTGQDTDKKSFEHLENHFKDLEDLRINAALEARDSKSQSTNPNNPLFELRKSADGHFSQYMSANPGGDELFGQYVLPLFDAKGLLGSYGLDAAHAALSPEHIRGWEKIGKALKLAENYDKAVEEGIARGVDAAMEAKRKAGNAGNVGAQGKQSGGGDGDKDSALREFWAGRHG